MGRCDGREKNTDLDIVLYLLLAVPFVLEHKEWDWRLFFSSMKTAAHKQLRLLRAASTRALELPQKHGCKFAFV